MFIVDQDLIHETDGIQGLCMLLCECFQLCKYMQRISIHHCQEISMVEGEHHLV